MDSDRLALARTLPSARQHVSCPNTTQHADGVERELLEHVLRVKERAGRSSLLETSPCTTSTTNLRNERFGELEAGVLVPPEPLLTVVRVEEAAAQEVLEHGDSVLLLGELG
jgi:hypothetical protein